MVTEIKRHLTEEQLLTAMVDEADQKLTIIASQINPEAEDEDQEEAEEGEGSMAAAGSRAGRSSSGSRSRSRRK